MNRVARVLEELAESIKPGDFTRELMEHIPVTALQRLGYIFDRVIQNQALSDAIYGLLQTNGVSLLRIPLKHGIRKTGFSSDGKWKVIINVKIQAEE